MTLDPTQAERAQDAAQTAERGRQIRKAALASIRCQTAVPSP